MNEYNAAGTRVAERPLWTMLLVQFLIGPFYRPYWMWRTNEDLARFGRARTSEDIRLRAGINANGALAATFMVLAMPGWLLIYLGALPWGASFAPEEYGGAALTLTERSVLVGIGAVLLVPAMVSILRTHRHVRRARRLAGLPADTPWTGAWFYVALLLELALLPVWQLILQHSLNDLWSHYPALLDEDLHGELAPPQQRAAAMARRPALHHARLERIADELEHPRLVPWTTISFAVLCVGVFVFQLTQHGPFPDDADIEAVGGLRTGLDGIEWRFFSANVLHGSVEHLTGNLLMWAFVGTMVERVVSHGRMVLLIMVGAAACSTGALIAEPDIVGVGASGVVFAAVGLAVVVDPLARRAIGRFGWTLALLGIGLSTFAPGVSAGGHVGGILGGFAVGLVIAVVWRVPRITRAKGIPIHATALLDRTAPLAPLRELTIQERLAHLARQRDAGSLAPHEFERLRAVLELRG